MEHRCDGAGSVSDTDSLLMCLGRPQSDTESLNLIWLYIIAMPQLFVLAHRLNS